MEERGYQDEMIQKMRQEKEKLEAQRHSEEVVTEEIKQSIYDDVVTVFGIPMIFRDRDIIENKATIRMPYDFVARSEEEIASVYFMGTKPQYAFSNGYLDMILAFNWTSNFVPDAGIINFAKFARQAIERIGPNAHIMNEDKLERKDGNLAILQFVSQAIDSVNYNVMFFSSLEGRLLIGSMTFDQKYTKRLIPLALEMAKSFHIKKKEEEIQA